MKQERTIAISEKNAALYQKLIDKKGQWREEHSPANLVTKFGATVEVWIVLHPGDEPRIEASFYVNKVLIQSKTNHSSILGTYTFHALSTEYVVHVRTVEEIEAEEARYVRPNTGSINSKKGISKDVDNHSESGYFRLVGWDEFDEVVGELVEHEDMSFETYEELTAHFTSGVDYIWRHYELIDTSSDKEYRTEIPENTTGLSERKAEVHAWLQSLPIT